MNKIKPLIDCPKCGIIGHYLGGGPGFDGVRVCPNGCGTWDDDNLDYWNQLNKQNETTN